MTSQKLLALGRSLPDCQIARSRLSRLIDCFHFSTICPILVIRTMRTAALLLALAATSAAASGRSDAAEAAATSVAGAKPAAATRTRRRRTTAGADADARAARRMHKVPEETEEVETRVEGSAEDLPVEAPLAGEEEFLTPNEEADVSVFIEQEIEAKEEEGLADAAAAVISGVIDDGEYDDEDLVEGSMSVDWMSMSMAEGSLSMDGSMSGAGSVDVRRRRRMTEAANRHRRRRIQSRRAKEMTA